MCFLLDGKKNVRIIYKGKCAVWILEWGEQNFLFFESLNADVRFLTPGYRDHWNI